MEHPAEEGPENGDEGPEAGKYRAEEVGDAGGHLPGQVLCLLGKVLDNAGVLGMAEGVEERGERPLEIAEGGSLIGEKEAGYLQKKPSLSPKNRCWVMRNRTREKKSPASEAVTSPE